MALAGRKRLPIRRGFDPWVGKMPWRRAWQPLQHSRLESPTDRGAWWATAHGVAHTRTRRSDSARTLPGLWPKEGGKPCSRTRALVAAEGESPLAAALADSAHVAPNMRGWGRWGEGHRVRRTRNSPRSELSPSIGARLQRRHASARGPAGSLSQSDGHKIRSRAPSSVR